MSMNLCFETSDGVGHLEFPFQTPTTLTKTVLKESDNTKRLEILRNYMIKQEWDSKVIDNKMQQIEDMFNSSYLVLTEI